MSYATFGYKFTTKYNIYNQFGTINSTALESIFIIFFIFKEVEEYLLH